MIRILKKLTFLGKGGIAGVERFQKSRILKKLLREQMEGGRIYGGICSSPTILQKQGLLKVISV